MGFDCFCLDFDIALDNQSPCIIRLGWSNRRWASLFSNKRTFGLGSEVKAHAFCWVLLDKSNRLAHPLCFEFSVGLGKFEPKQIKKRAQWPVLPRSLITKFHSSPLTFECFHYGPNNFQFHSIGSLL